MNILKFDKHFTKYILIDSCNISVMYVALNANLRNFYCVKDHLMLPMLTRDDPFLSEFSSFFFER